ncbi:MFS transporter [Haloterrigena sp. H1]|uniref:MFS transporter n=1 Tax=Haloterrigena sp. H1 TaxID=2552943 RepID=UPI00110E568A|nr:MFS transporter [Haloterrigena sp. H1]TMT86909.1 MFS transporter [Haloterrigena sp. H1]
MSSNAVADEPVRKLALALGFLAITVSTLVAHRSPATGYELSLYTMTPQGVWAGLIVAFAVSLAVAFDRSIASSRTRSLALVLGGLALTVFAGLPIVRGYHFFGQQDALTHLGWARGISNGTISPFELLYPGIHTVSVFINSAIGITLSNAMLLVVLLATIAFVVFVPLSVGLLVPDSLAVTIATFTGFLLLPITTISTFMQPHAMTQSILLFALFIYIILKYVTTDDCPSTALAALFALVATAAVVYHPQYAAHMLIVCIGICLLQFLAPRLPYFSRTSIARRMADHQRLYGQTLFLLAVFLAWSENHGFFAGFAGRAVSSALTFLLIGSGDAGTSISQQGGSLAAIGVSLTEIFFKLFFPHVVITLLAAGLILAVLFRGRLNRFPDIPPVTMYLAAGLFALGILFAVYFMSVTSEMYFRVFGLMMVFAAILASIAIYEGLLFFSDRLSPTVVQTVVAGAFALLLVLSLLSVFASPYVYRQSQHVSEQQLHGYETAFDNAADGIAFAGFRGAPNRYADALNGQETRTRAHTTVTPETVEQGPTTYYDTDRYLVVSQLDYEREIVAYRGLRYSEDDFDAIATDPSLDRVQSNGELTTYYVSASNDAA